MSIIEGAAPLQTSPIPEEARLRQSSRDLEGVFVEQLFKAMRETVPEGSLFGGGAGEEMFTGMMDAHLAAEVPAAWDDGIANALYRQLRAALGPTDADGVHLLREPAGAALPLDAEPTPIELPDAAAQAAATLSATEVGR